MIYIAIYFRLRFALVNYITAHQKFVLCKSMFKFAIHFKTNLICLSEIFRTSVEN